LNRPLPGLGARGVNIIERIELQAPIPIDPTIQHMNK